MADGGRTTNNLVTGLFRRLIDNVDERLEISGYPRINAQVADGGPRKMPSA